MSVRVPAATSLAGALCALALVGLAGCKEMKACRPGTAFVTLRCPAGVAVDHFEVDARDLTSGRGGALATITARCPSTGLELTIPEYAAGHELHFTVRATSAANAEVGRGEKTVTLGPECTAIELPTVAATDDGGVTDGGADTGAGGGIDGGRGGTGGGGAGGAGGVDAGVDVRPPDADADGGCGAPRASCVGNDLVTCQPSGAASTIPCPNGCNTQRNQCNVCNPAAAPTCSTFTNMVTRCRADGTGTDMMTCGANGCRTDLTDCLTCSPAQHGCDGVCASNTSPATCGQSCAPCPGVPNGESTCNGTSCGFNCPAATMRCNPGKDYCEKTLWTFETGIEGWASQASADRSDDGILTISAVRAHGGQRSLSAGLTINNGRYRFRLNFWPCGRDPSTLGGPEALDLRGRTMSVWVLLEHDGLNSGHTCTLVGRSGTAFIGPGVSSAVTPGTWSRVFLDFGAGTPSSTVTILSIDCSFSTFPFSTGTIYVDDVSIQ